jgi:microcystin-dependent protein
MAESYEFYSSTATDTRSYTLSADMAAFFRQMIANTGCGVVHGTPGGNLLAVTQHSTGDRSVDVADGQAWVYGFHMTNDASLNLAVDTNTSGNPRIDSVILRNSVTGTKDIQIVILKGTAAASPVAPTLTQTASTYEIRLADLYLANGYSQILTANITDQRFYATIARVAISQLLMDADLVMGSQLIVNASPAAGATDALTKVDVDTYASVFYPLPPGAVVGFGKSTVPGGFLKCDGAAISRTTYASLFSAIGVLYGVGDGSTTFNLPDLRLRTIVGHSGVGDYYYMGQTGGEATHTLTEGELPYHTHNVTYATVSSGLGQYAGSSQTVGTPGSGTTGSTGSGGDHQNLPPYLKLVWGIKI